jgi:hypothetical protein
MGHELRSLWETKLWLAVARMKRVVAGSCGSKDGPSTISAGLLGISTVQVRAQERRLNGSIAGESTMHHARCLASEGVSLRVVNRPSWVSNFGPSVY